jgi:hypothetical protein
MEMLLLLRQSRDQNFCSSAEIHFAIVQSADSDVTG